MKISLWVKYARTYLSSAQNLRINAINFSLGEMRKIECQNSSPSDLSVLCGFDEAFFIALGLALCRL